MGDVEILEIFDTLAREDAPHNGLMRLTRRVMQTECLANSQSTVHKLFERWKDVCCKLDYQTYWWLDDTRRCEFPLQRNLFKNRIRILDTIECEVNFVFSEETICSDWFNILLCESMAIKTLHALIFEKYPSARLQASKYSEFCYNLLSHNFIRSGLDDYLKKLMQYETNNHPAS